MTNLKYYKKDKDGEWYSKERYLELTELKNKYFQESKQYRRKYEELCRINKKVSRQYIQVNGELESTKKSIRKVISTSYSGSSPVDNYSSPSIYGSSIGSCSSSGSSVDGCSSI